jgi:hypothetical protein
MSSFLTKILGGPVVGAATGIANIIDQFVETPDEKRLAEEIRLRMQREPAKAQIGINMIEAKHRSLFVAGWRPSIGWVCSISLGMYYIPQFALGAFLWTKMSLEADKLLEYPVDASSLFELVLAMLGMGALRTVEKVLNKTK